MGASISLALETGSDKFSLNKKTVGNLTIYTVYHKDRKPPEGWNRVKELSSRDAVIACCENFLDEAELVVVYEKSPRGGYYRAIGNRQRSLHLDDGEDEIEILQQRKLNLTLAPWSLEAFSIEAVGSFTVVVSVETTDFPPLPPEDEDGW